MCRVNTPHAKARYGFMSVSTKVPPEPMTKESVCSVIHFDKFSLIKFFGEPTSVPELKYKYKAIPNALILRMSYTPSTN